MPAAPLQGYSRSPPPPSASTGGSHLDLLQCICIPSIQNKGRIKSEDGVEGTLWTQISWKWHLKILQREASDLGVVNVKMKLLLLCVTVAFALQVQGHTFTQSSLPHVGARVRYRSVDRRYDAFSARIPVNVEYVSNATGGFEDIAWAFPRGCSPNASTLPSANFTCGTDIIGPQIVSVAPKNNPTAVQSFVIDMRQKSGTDRYAWYAALEHRSQG